MAEYIDKQAFNDAIIREAVRKYPSTFYNGLEVARQIAHDLPAADVQPVRHGRWQRLDDRRGSYLFYCSECGGRAYYVHGVRKGEPVCGYRYCPNCGAKMDECP